MKRTTTGATKHTVVAALTGILACTVAAADDRDFGSTVEWLLKAHSEKLFGVGRPLAEPAPATVGPYRTSQQRANDQISLAGGLRVEYLTRKAANSADMMAFFPATHPTHIVNCVEGGRETLANGKLNPSVQRIDLKTGEVETILRGMSRCDGARATAWGTVIVNEETTDGAVYEILDPLNVTEQSVLDRSTGAVTDPTHIAKRTALPTMAWEGMATLPSGVVFGGDELRPGTPLDTDGGALFKFVPAVPRAADAGPSANLAQSPLAAGSAYAMQISCVDNTQQYGQGCEVGNATWVLVNAATARLDANVVGATGFYRPEDLHMDPTYVDATNADAVRVCWTNTGNEGASHYAEVMCAVDSAPLTASATERTVVANRFVEGDPRFNSFDNLAFQPRTGNLYIIEDHDNGEVFACLPDGADRDIKTDGCVSILSVKDSSAEPTGFIFSPDGATAYVSIQHSDDTLMPLVDGYPTDDVLKITGFRVKSHKRGWWN
jgi:secreted PhoX family phosphatase